MLSVDSPTRFFLEYSKRATFARRENCPYGQHPLSDRPLQPRFNELSHRIIMIRFWKTSSFGVVNTTNWSVRQYCFNEIIILIKISRIQNVLLCSLSVIAGHVDSTEQQLDVVVAYRNKVQPTRTLLYNWSSTSWRSIYIKLILHALYASQQALRSYNIDVLIIALTYSSPLWIYLVRIDVNSTFTFYEERATALLGLHSQSGADVTGS